VECDVAENEVNICKMRLDSRVKFEYFVGKQIGKHGGKRFEVIAGWQLRKIVYDVRAC